MASLATAPKLANSTASAKDSNSGWEKKKALLKLKQQKKKERKKKSKLEQRRGAHANGDDGGSGEENDDGGVENEADRDDGDFEIEYVSETPVLDVESNPEYAELAKVFQHFQFQGAAGAGGVEGGGGVDDGGASSAMRVDDGSEASAQDDARASGGLKREGHDADSASGKEGDEDEDDGDTEEDKISKRRRKLLSRLTVAELKQLVKTPDVVEVHDVTSRDPKLLVTLKATRNTVPVPKHWSQKRKYLQNKRGQEKPPFDLPDFIKATGIMELRESLQEKEQDKTLRARMRESVRPKMGKIAIDYQKLENAFFKWQTKPPMTRFGEMYYEGKEFETKVTNKKPGVLSVELREALGMPTSGPGATLVPPPWLISMQRYGPPPSYPNLKIPGLNAPIPPGASFGYHVGGWGRPPVDEYGRPLYGDVFGTISADYNKTLSAADAAPVQKTLWGQLEEVSEDEDDEGDEDMDEDEDDSGDKEAGGEAEGAEGANGAEDDSEDLDAAEKRTQAAIAAEIHGLETPSGLSSVPAGLETPDVIELRKRRIESAMERGGDDGDEAQPAKQLYTIIPEKKATVGSALMGSQHIYDIAAASASKAKRTVGPGVEIALDPSELDELDQDKLREKMEATLQEQESEKTSSRSEDLSDMVAEQAARQSVKRKKAQEGKSKKYKF